MVRSTPNSSTANSETIVWEVEGDIEGIERNWQGQERGKGVEEAMVEVEMCDTSHLPTCVAMEAPQCAVPRPPCSS